MLWVIVRRVRAEIPSPVVRGGKMTPEEHERMLSLCKRIQDEKNQETFSKLVHDLDVLLAKKEERRGQGEPKISLGPGS